MSAADYQHPSSSDLPEIAEVLNRSRHELPYERDLTLDEVNADLFDDEDFNSSGCWIGRVEGKAVAFGRAIVEQKRQELGLNDGFALVEVVPEYRGRGIEEELMKRILDFFNTTDLRLAQYQAATDRGWRNELALGFGFKEVRRFFRMELKALAPIRRLVPPRGVSIQSSSFKEADNKTIVEFAEAFNEYFADHFNFSPVSPSKWIRWRDVSQDIGRVMFAKLVDKPVGVLLAEESAEFNRRNNTSLGWIWILAVSKDHRHLGIGTYLLTEGVNWLINRGMRTVLLGVDAENRGALGIYTSAGFEVLSETVVYRLKLVGGNAPSREVNK